MAERRRDQHDADQEDRDARRDRDGKKGPPTRRRCRPEPAVEHRHRRPDERERNAPLDVVCRDSGSVVVRQDEGVFGTAGAGEVGVADVVLEQHQRPLDERDVDIGDDDDPPGDLGLEPSCRVREDQVRERSVHEQVEREPDREQRLVVRLDQRVEEPRKTYEGHQNPDPVVRAPDHRDEAAGHEDDAETDDQRRAFGLVGLVVRREDEDERKRRGRRRRERDAGDDPGPHARRVASIAPESSAFGTKPRALLSATDFP